MNCRGRSDLGDQDEKGLILELLKAQIYKMAEGYGSPLSDTYAESVV